MKLFFRSPGALGNREKEDIAGITSSPAGQGWSAGRMPSGAEAANPQHEDS